jgi:D-amino-acid oxidase
VVGAGVIGMTCAVRLAEDGHRVEVLARDLPLETTSVVAAALWYPYLALPRDRVTAWAENSYAAFAMLAGNAGVQMLSGTEVLHEQAADPWWMTAVPELTRVPPPTGYADAWSFTSPVIDMPIYLQWLRARFAGLGGTVTRISMSSLPVSDDAVVVNCTGLGARRLAGDEDVRPVRGQVVVVDGVDLDHWWVDATGPTYVVPRERTVIVGGTDEQGEWSRTPSPETATEILQRASRLVPELAGANVVGHRVGLRPVRPSVRLDAKDGVIHCYGHGGAGVTLSWGCADEVSHLVAEHS